MESSHAKSYRTRQIPLNEEAMEVLGQWQSQTGQNAEFEFSDRSGHRLINIQKAWQKLLSEVVIEHFRWHDLWHHFTSRLVIAGVDLNTVRELPGHSTITMNLRYAHLAPGHKAAAVSRIAYGSHGTGNPWQQPSR